MTQPQPLPLPGGCLCGAIRYRIIAEPLTLYACHCTNCQTQSGSAFALSMPVARATFEITRGRLQSWHRTTPSGARAIVQFCAVCGCRLYAERPSRPASVTVRAGTLDDTSWLRPVAHIWTRSAQPWMRFDTDVLTFATQPDDFGSIIDAWKQRDR